MCCDDSVKNVLGNYRRIGMIGVGMLKIDASAIDSGGGSTYGGGPIATMYAPQPQTITPQVVTLTPQVTPAIPAPAQIPATTQNNMQTVATNANAYNVSFQVLANNVPIPYAQYWFIDGDSKPLSNVAVTDDQGKSFVSVQEYDDPASRWVNFSAQGYTPIVKSISELQANGDVNMQVAGKKSIDWGLLLGAAGLGVTIIAARKKKKRVTGIVDQAKQRFNRSSTPQKLLIVGASGFGAYLILDHFFGNKPTQEQKQEVDSANDYLKQLADYYGIFPTLNATQYAGMVNEIKTAVDDCGTDESTIYSVFNKLVNEADLYKLIASYRVQSYKGCFEGHYFGDVTRTLSETLHGDLDSYEISKINSILRGKSIKYQF